MPSVFQKRCACQVFSRRGVHAKCFPEEVCMPSVFQKRCACQVFSRRGVHAKCFPEEVCMPSVFQKRCACQVFSRRGVHAKCFPEEVCMPSVFQKRCACQVFSRRGVHAKCFPEEVCMPSVCQKRCACQVFSRRGVHAKCFPEEVCMPNVFRCVLQEKTVPQVCVRQGGLGFDSELQELYSAVTSYDNTNARKRKISERHAPEEDESTTEDRDPNHAASGTQPSGEEVNHGLDQGDKRQTGRGDRARTTDSETPNEEKTTVPMATAADRPSARPKKKKAKGLFG
ncbi:uncharacterized protein LOC127916791 isoform X20 [Oncorhynchus keta]|nr:uncharacterized protein LOC127916791 isoform X2 [Oncorhynchus keta]XP_052355954.1 uncharacterized protein LOC127916791 isoform X15 [Oncorhynchus keta]XP_052355955.1 uncharacterized protein LOC127916791 isoform X16 [Oncorhynchus keta]XP_052355959.1 uncharacterized protein LOC127916791 isoform X20 [Oncorhynchus keta]